jgi:hypothetical protein
MLCCAVVSAGQARTLSTQRAMLTAAAVTSCRHPSPLRESRLSARCFQGAYTRATTGMDEMWQKDDSLTGVVCEVVARLFPSGH